ncbi:protein mono-ADP-ribosyltransferase PARP14-like isoform X2 [Haliotis asinina]
MSTSSGDHAGFGSPSPGPDQAPDHPETVPCPPSPGPDQAPDHPETVPCHESYQNKVQEGLPVQNPSMSKATSAASLTVGTHDRPETTNPELELPEHDKKRVRETLVISDEIDAMFLRSTKGRWYVEEVAQRNCCDIIKTTAGLEGASASMADIQEHPENTDRPMIPDHKNEEQFRSRLNMVTRPFQKKVELITGSIAELEADVIVNSTNAELNWKAGAVSSSIVQKAGSKLEKKLKKRYGEGFKGRPLITTKGYKLPCTEIYHVCLPKWDTSDALDKLKSIVRHCLEEASRSKYARLLFPAFGTGNLHYDKNMSARTIYEAVNNFWVENPSTTLKSVKVVIYPGQENVNKAFQEEHEACYGKYVSRRGRRLSIQDEPAPDDDVTRGVLLGKVRFKVVEGDILQESVDLIVNGSNSKLDLSCGIVSKKLQKKFGKDLEKECKEKVDDIARTGLAVTCVSGASFKAVLHYDSHFFKGISEVLQALLEKAEELKITSLALPALDQGRRRGISKDKLAEHVFSSLTKHSSLRYLREVQMVIFQEHDLYTSLVNLFKTIINDHALATSEEDAVKPLLRRGSSAHETHLYEVTLSSDSEQNLDKAIVELVSTPEIKTDSLTKSCFVNITCDKLKSLYDHAKTHSVGISVNTNIGSVTAKGFEGDLYNMMKHVYEICNELQASQNEAKSIQWYYVDVRENGERVQEKYHSDVNEHIELAYRAEEPLCNLTTDDGVRYVIDFNEMVEYKEGNKQNTSVVVFRRSLIETSTSDFDRPVSWEPMKPDEKLLVVPLSKQDPEYCHVDAMFSVPKMEVLKIERIQNKDLYKQFAAMRTQLNVSETQLWHGTDFEAIGSINNTGFDRGFSGKHAAQYGKGAYFSTDPTYSTNKRFSKPDSKGYKYIYLADVLVGRYTQGKKGINVAPPIDPANPAVRFDSVVDDITNPQKYVIFRDAQAYPKYLVTYREVDTGSAVSKETSDS